MNADKNAEFEYVLFYFVDLYSAINYNENQDFKTLIEHKKCTAKEKFAT